MVSSGYPPQPLSFERKPLQNWIKGQWKPVEGVPFCDVTDPATEEVIAQTPMCTSAHVDEAVAAAKEAFVNWSAMTCKTRSQALFKVKQIIEDRKDEIAKLIVLEHGKCYPEAMASLMKGVETIEYACGAPALLAGRHLEVSRGIQCYDVREPVGIVATVVPFNFPAMVPLWSIPMSLVTGNCVVIKPSEKVPLTFCALVQCFKDAGLPDGVLNVVHGGREVVESFCDHKDINVVTFVGSTPVAKAVAKRSRDNGKRCLALGGAKNHLVLLEDADLKMSCSDICNSYAGSAGQRCMAASVLLLVGQASADRLIGADFNGPLVQASKALKAGQGAGEVGPLIDQAAVDRVTRYVDEAEKSGAKILVDGRAWKSSGKGFWFGPTVILHNKPTDPAITDEIFGPVLSIFICQSHEEALQIENANPFGNAACIYTSSGKWAQFYTKRFSAAMLGVNIGIPVPREPFSFGGMNASKFGDCDITGEGGINLFTLTKKITQKYSAVTDKDDYVAANFTR